MRWRVVSLPVVIPALSAVTVLLNVFSGELMRRFFGYSNSLYSLHTPQLILPELNKRSYPLFNHKNTSSLSSIVNQTSSSSHEHPRYAYAFVVGGCDPKYPTYRYYIYNILVSAKILREQGSKADVVALFQLVSSSNETTLPKRYIRLLQAINVQTYYIPKQPNENFYRTQIDKFRILSLTQYSRVLFMDGDVMPTANLDYLFELSEQGVIKENLVIEGLAEPANGGFFMLKPKLGYLREMQDIIHRRETNPYDPVIGWGHMIMPPDEWTTALYSGRNWTFLAAFADQGLLYHWVKYACKSVSVYKRNKILENWSSVGHDAKAVRLEESLHDPFVNFSKPAACFGRGCYVGPPLTDFFHFTSFKKPWMVGFPNDEVSYGTRLKSEQHFWFYNLKQLNDQLQMNHNFSTWVGGRTQKPSLGLYPKEEHIQNSNTNLLTELVRETREIDANITDELEFCPDCIWQDGRTCQARKNYILMKTKDTDDEVTEYMMKKLPQCNH